MTAPDLPLEAAERLGPYYVYVLVDPTDDSVFYVGKGSRQRLLMHGREADLVVDEKPRSSKVRRIRAIRNAGHEPRVDVVRHGLDEPQALLVEAALIDCLDGSTNAVEGHGSDQGRKPLSEYVARYGAPPVAADAPPVVLIRVGQWREMDEEMEPGVRRHGNGYRPGISPEELVDSACGGGRSVPGPFNTEASAMPSRCTTVSPGRSWRSVAGPSATMVRRAFTATPILDGPMFDTWVGPVGKRVTFVAASRNPITYGPLRRRPPGQ